MDEIYNDIWVKGSVVHQGIRSSADRYEAVCKVLGEFKRPFTMLDLGCNHGYFSFRAADEFDCVAVMVDVYDSALEFCQKNGLVNTIFLHSNLIVEDLEDLADCEHFDVVLALNIVHHFGYNWKRALDAIFKMGYKVVVETPSPLDHGACGQEAIPGIVEYLSNREYELLGEFKSHTSNVLRQMKLFTGESTHLLTKPFFRCPHVIDTDAVIQCGVVEKTISFERKLENRRWVNGLNLWTYKQLGGIYPSRQQIVDKLSSFVLPSEPHGDVTIWNFLFDGDLHLIDAGHRWMGEDHRALKQAVASFGLVPVKTVKDKVWGWSGRLGYYLQDALTFACEQIKPKRYLEIGVDGGGSLEAVVRATKLKSVVLCDIWNPEYCAHGFMSHDHLLPIFDKSSVGVMYLDGDSNVTVPENLAGKEFDLVTIDGGHMPFTAEADLNNCWPLLRVGGILAFDDIAHRSYPHLEGVIRLFLEEHSDAVVIPEKNGLWKFAALITKV